MDVSIPMAFVISKEPGNPQLPSLCEEETGGYSTEIIFDCLLTGIVNTLPGKVMNKPDSEVQVDSPGGAEKSTPQGKNSKDTDHHTIENVTPAVKGVFNLMPGIQLMNVPTNFLGTSDTLTLISQEDMENTKCVIPPLKSPLKSPQLFGDPFVGNVSNKAVLKDEIISEESALRSQMKSLSDVQDNRSIEIQNENVEIFNDTKKVFQSENKSCNKNAVNQYLTTDSPVDRTSLTTEGAGKAEIVSRQATFNQNAFTILSKNTAVVNNENNPTTAPFSKGRQEVVSDVTDGFRLVESIKDIPQGRLQSEPLDLNESLQSTQGISKEQNKGGLLTETDTKPENIFFTVYNRKSEDNFPVAHQVKEPSEVITLPENKFVVIKKDDTSLKITIEPDGLGKLDLELNLDRGVVNTQISASETIGKELIEKNLFHILDALMKEGLSIGDFSVSLRNKRDEMKENFKAEELKVSKFTNRIQVPIDCNSANVISIFV